ncbi:hypothetical protein A3715_15890 [Oleiphilus sp. HI0009]|nr:hypothetical protein A3715_15890 [Oleiphilus sp. HI0009]
MYGKNNQEFLASILSDHKKSILKNIANHYGKTQSEIYDEVTMPSAEHLTEYMREPLRSATFSIMDLKGFGFIKKTETA